MQYGYVTKRYSWRTTTAGVAAILAAAAGLLKALSENDFDTAMAIAPGLFAGVSALFARDNKVSSEEAGAK